MENAHRIIASRQCRSTGSVINLVDNRDGWYEAGPDGKAEPECRWVTECESHGFYLCHATRALATSFMAAPEEWCEACDNELTTAGERWDEMRLEA